MVRLFVTEHFIGPQIAGRSKNLLKIIVSGLWANFMHIFSFFAEKLGKTVRNYS